MLHSVFDGYHFHVSCSTQTLSVDKQVITFPTSGFRGYFLLGNTNIHPFDENHRNVNVHRLLRGEKIRNPNDMESQNVEKNLKTLQ